MHINKHLKDKATPNLFPHGKGSGLPLVPKKKRLGYNHALEEKVRIRRIKNKKRTQRIRRKLRVSPISK